MARPFPFTDNQVQSILSLYAAGNSTVAIAKLFGDHNDAQILYALEKYGMQRRHMHSYPGRSVSLSSQAVTFIVGILLGDGSLHPILAKRGTSHVSITQRIDRTDFLYWMSDKFAEFGIGSRVGAHNIKPEGRMASRALRTIKTTEFGDMRQQWYPYGKKIVPQDVQIGRDSLLPWYMSDGSRQPMSGVTFYTNAFSFGECQYLKHLLFANLNLSVDVHSRTPGTNSWATHKDVGMPNSIHTQKGIGSVFRSSWTLPRTIFRIQMA